jgi:RNA polymerase sigma factor (sigma-70 family)
MRWKLLSDLGPCAFKYSGALKGVTVYMPSTLWTTILQFHADPERVKDFVVRRYRQPVVEFAALQGLSREDAEDAAQEVFVRVCRPEFLKKANEIRGKFRTVLLTVTKRVIVSLRRHDTAGMRDRRRQIPLEGFDLPEDTPPDPEFDRLWVKNLVEQALESLEADAAVQALRLHLKGDSYSDISGKLGRKVTDVTNLIHRARERLRREIERLVAEYSSREDVAEEIAALRRFL